MKKILLALLFALLFTGCIERGENLQPTYATSEIKLIQLENSNIVLTSTLSPIKQDTVSPKETITKINAPVNISHVDIANETVKDECIFPLSDETKNQISGFFILVIGVIILL